MERVVEAEEDSMSKMKSGEVSPRPTRLLEESMYNVDVAILKLFGILKEFALKVSVSVEASPRVVLFSTVKVEILVDP